MAEADLSHFSDARPERPVADLIASRIWHGSPLGPPSEWSASFRTTVSIIMRAEVEMALFWGPDLIVLYNDAFAAAIGDKHPFALGRPAREIWVDMWTDIEPLLEGVRLTGESFYAKDRRFLIERRGSREYAYMDVSYSAVPDDDGGIGGVFCIISETTDRILAERRLKESENRLRALVNATADLVYRITADWKEISWLDVRGNVGFTGVPGTNWKDGYLPPEDHATMQAAIEEATAAVRPLRIEHRVLLKDGAIGWLASRVVPITDDSGRITEWFGSSTDVTERHRSSEHLELVFNELNHRVKNNLAMIQAVAGQTFRTATSLGDAKERFSARLMALARANDLLRDGRWSGTDLRDAIDQAVTVYQQEQGRVSIAGPDVDIPPRLALPLALAIHELSTNASKYGAWANDTGRVAIEWSTFRTSEGAERLRIEWRETGGPPVVTPERRGFGSRLIEQALASELNGEAVLQFEHTGLRCLIESPLPV